jgi:predicted amidophosphoribosyltransferase
MENSEDNIGYFFNRLDPILKKGFPIAIVPSHDPDERNWGLIKLVRRLSSAGRIDASSCLVRTVKIDTQHNLKEGERKKLKRHLDSIEVRDELLDDIVTTGTSLMACKKLLLDAGASEVICMALGKATQ